MSFPCTALAYQSESENQQINICQTLAVDNCQETVDVNPNPVTIDGKIYTAKDGLEHHQISGNLAKAHNKYQSKDWWPYHDMYVNWGNSWVRNQEIGYLHYRGTTQAGGDVYSGKRIIQTTLTYKRDGKILGTAKSNAVFKSNSWKAGVVDTVWATDSIDSQAPKTQFTYDYYSIDPRLVG